MCALRAGPELSKWSRGAKENTHWAICAQHAEPLGYTGPEMTTPSMEAIENIKFDQPAVTLYGSHTPFHVKAIRQIYRVMQLTGRKMIIDTMVAKGL